MVDVQEILDATPTEGASGCYNPVWDMNREQRLAYAQELIEKENQANKLTNRFKVWIEEKYRYLRWYFAHVYKALRGRECYW